MDSTVNFEIPSLSDEVRKLENRLRRTDELLGHVLARIRGSGREYSPDYSDILTQWEEAHAKLMGVHEKRDPNAA